MPPLSGAEQTQLDVLLKKQAEPALKLQCEVTALIPVRNALDWGHGSLYVTLYSLEPGTQSTPVRLILCDNGSEDGTQLVLKAMAEPAVAPDIGLVGVLTHEDKIVRQYWLCKFPEGLDIAEPEPTNEELGGQARTNYHLKNMYQRMVDMVQTDYMMTVDADVEVPRGAVRTMLDALKNDPELGLVGIGYGSCDHIQHGLAMMRTEDAKLLTWGEDGCTCRFLDKEMQRMGKKVMHLSPLSARHTKDERG